MIGLFVRSGRLKGKCFVLEDTVASYTVGSDPSCAIVLEDEGVSRRHLELSSRNGRWWARDLGSRNGTLLNGLSLEESVLTPRDVLVIGALEMQVVTRDRTRKERPPRGEPATTTLRFDPAQLILGGSQAIQEVIHAIRAVADRDATVLVLGETGVGKELVARAMHSASRRSAGKFVAVNCASIPKELVESELFGHEKGAFTGAASRRKGRFEEADGGTLFLDEIGELPASAQGTLLRALETRSFQRVGGNSDIRVDMRIVAATNRDLGSEIGRGSFRADLYHRLATVEIRVPPLRERPSDVRALAQHLIEGLAIDHGKPSLALTEGVLQALERHRWPGNVRELRNVLERAVLLAPAAEIGPAEIEASLSKESREAADRQPLDASVFPPLEAFEGQQVRRHLKEALRRSGGNKKKAAELLGISRMTLYEKLKKYGIGGS